MNMSKKKKLQLDIADITTLIELLKNSGINEIEITQGELGIRLRKDPPPAAAPVQTVHSTPTAPAAGSSPPSTVPAGVPKVEGKVLKSPMVGTFYTASSPEASPYVKIGDAVKKGQTICIIEAMKTMNQIEAEEDGILKEVLVNNAQAVEFGEPLFIIQ